MMVMWTMVTAAEYNLAWSGMHSHNTRGNWQPESPVFLRINDGLALHKSDITEAKKLKSRQNANTRINKPERREHDCLG